MIVFLGFMYSVGVCFTSESSHFPHSIILEFGGNTQCAYDTLSES